jgi:glutathione S-transferase
MLEELGQSFETKLLSFGPEMKTPAYLALNPMGKVPTLVHDGVVITETAAIIAYLADAFPEAGLAPELSSPARGAYYRWLFFGAGPFEAAATNNYLKVEVQPKQESFVGYGSFKLVLDTLESALSQGPYLLGDQFSAADVYIAAQIGLGLRFGSIEPRPAFHAYYQRLSARPAALRAAAIDDALLAQKA